MKNIFSSFLICAVLLISCKEESVKKVVVEENITAQEEKQERFQYSLAQWSLHEPMQNGELDPLDFAKYAGKLGFQGVEYVTQLYPQVQGKEDHDKAVMDLAAVLKVRSEEYGIENVLIMVDHEGELADPSPEKREEAIENHKAWVDAAQYLGAHSIRVNLFGIEEPLEWHKVSVASLTKLSTYAATKGVNVIVENHGGLSSDAAKLAAVMKEVGMDNCGTLPDFGNFCVKRRDGDRWSSPCVDEYDMYKGIAELMPYAKGVSAKAYNFDENGMETKIDYPKMMRIIEDSGFEGFIGVEFEGPMNPYDGIKLTKKLIEKSLQPVKLN